MDNKIIDFLAMPTLGVCFHTDKLTPPVCKFPYDFRRVRTIAICWWDPDDNIPIFLINTMTDTVERVSSNTYHIGYKK